MGWAFFFALVIVLFIVNRILKKHKEEEEKNINDIEFTPLYQTWNNNQPTINQNPLKSAEYRRISNENRRLVDENAKLKLKIKSQEDEIWHLNERINKLIDRLDNEGKLK